MKAPALIFLPNFEWIWIKFSFLFQDFVVLKLIPILSCLVNSQGTQLHLHDFITKCVKYMLAFRCFFASFFQTQCVVINTFKPSTLIPALMTDFYSRLQSDKKTRNCAMIFFMKSLINPKIVGMVSKHLALCGVCHRQVGRALALLAGAAWSKHDLIVRRMDDKPTCRISLNEILYAAVTCSSPELHCLLISHDLYL